MRSYLKTVLVYLDDPGLTEMYDHDEVATKKLKTYIKGLLRNELKNLKGPIRAINGEKVHFKEAVKILEGFINFTKMNQS